MPQTHRWQDVIALIAGDGTAVEIADATLEAARRGLAAAVKDLGVRHVVWLMAQVALAAREPNFALRLRELGLPVSANPSTFELVAAVSDEVDDHLAGAGRTDFGEMAEMAAAESLTVMVGSRANLLFGTKPADVRDAVQELSTQHGFGSLAHDFFARFTRRFLNYHLSRELSCHVGTGMRFADVSDHGRFLERLDLTCQETALVVRDYAGDWYSKAKFEDGVSTRQVGRFVETSFTKLRAELERRGRNRGSKPSGGTHAA